MPKKTSTKPPRSAKRSTKTPKKSNRKLYGIVFAALLILLFSVFTSLINAKKVYNNLEYKEFPSSGIGIKVPNDWIEMQHGGSTMLHDSEIVDEDAVASIHIMSHEFLYTDFSNATNEERRNQLDVLAASLASSSTDSVAYSDIEIVDLNNQEVVMADSVESYSYLTAKKKAINVFMLTNSGEIKRIMITANEDIYSKNQKGMSEVARSVKLL